MAERSLKIALKHSFDMNADYAHSLIMKFDTVFMIPVQSTTKTIHNCPKQN